MDKIFSIILGSALVFLISCDYLAEEPIHNLLPEDQFTEERYIDYAVNHCYSLLPDGYFRFDNSMLEAATDDAAYAKSNSAINQLASSQNTASSPVINPWSDCYKGISQTYLIEDNIQRMYIPLSVNSTDLPAYIESLKVQYRAEIYMLRAFFYFELMKTYGGVPIITKFYEPGDEMTGIQRSTFEETVNHIVSLCDTTIAYYPSVTSTTLGRWGKGAAMAIKAKTLAYAASDLYNVNVQNELLGYTSGSQQQRQMLAAEALTEVIKLGTYALSGKYDMFNQAPNIANTSYNIAKEYIVFKGKGMWNGVESSLYPPTLGGKGTVFPTQDFVDCFDNLDGTPYVPEATLSQSQWSNRDPRLAMNIVYNEAIVRGSGATATKVYTFTGEGETTDGFQVVPQQSTTTGYYLKKYAAYASVDFNKTPSGNAHHLFPIIRYADILLLYAEMVNEAYGPTQDPFSCGYTPKSAVEAVRKRAGFSGTGWQITLTGDPQEDMFEKIKKERRVELCFEEQRYFDLRRWKDAATALSTPVHGIKITKTSDNTSYDKVVVDDSRNFAGKQYYTPIPYGEQVALSLTQKHEW